MIVMLIPMVDGLLDGLEITLGTDPNNVDSDGDGIEDGVEVVMIPKSFG